VTYRCFPLRCSSEAPYKRSLQCQEGYVILLLPPFSGKTFQIAQQEVDKRCFIGVLFEQFLQTWQAEHLTFRVMSLDQAIAVEKDVVSRGQYYFSL
jgi:hypothetical protein